MIRRRSGFTLVELLVVIAIIGVLVGLCCRRCRAARSGPPHVLQQQHEADRPGAASASRYVPAMPAGWDGYDATTGQPYGLGTPGWGWAARILPFIEQANVQENLIDFNRPVTDPVNDVVRLLRPADVPLPFRHRRRTSFSMSTRIPARGHYEFATANYVGAWGTGDVHVCGTLPVGVQCTSDGAFFHNSKIRFADMKDGLSQTFVAGERSSRLEYSTWVGTVAGIDCAPGRFSARPSTHPTPAGTRTTSAASIPRGRISCWVTARCG